MCVGELKGGRKKKRRVGAGCVDRRKNPKREASSTATVSLKWLRLLPCLVKGTRKPFETELCGSSGKFAKEGGEK